MLHTYMAYLKKTVQWLAALSKDEHLSLCWLYRDYLWAVLRHRCLIRQYVTGEFWKKSAPERKKCVTYARMERLLRKYNAADYVHVLNEKPDFNAYFHAFIQRKWLYSRKMTENSFLLFLKTCKTLIIKPVAGLQGGGYPQALC